MHYQGIIHIDPKSKPLIATHTCWIYLCQLPNKISEKLQAELTSHHYRKILKYLF